MLKGYMTEKIVNAHNIEGWNIPIWNNIFGAKIDFNCGECGFSQSTRIPLKDYPVVECKHCRTLNRIADMISKIIRVERTTEKPVYVYDNITKETRHIADEEFKGEKITHYRLVLANYLEIGLCIIPIDGQLDKFIPFWFWTEKEAVSSKFVEKLKK